MYHNKIISKNSLSQTTYHSTINLISIIGKNRHIQNPSINSSTSVKYFALKTRRYEAKYQTLKTSSSMKRLKPEKAFRCGTELEMAGCPCSFRYKSVSMQMKRNMGDVCDKEDRVNCVSVPDVKRLIAFRNVTYRRQFYKPDGEGGGKW